METLFRRRISEGTQYDSFFPKVSGGYDTVSEEAGVEDTLKLMQKTIPQTLWHTERIAQYLKGKSLAETCGNIWDFVYSHIQYNKDEKGKEQIRSPARAWADRKTGVDCDCYTEFISSILCNLGIPHKLRIAAYDPETGWQHIYPVVPKDGRTDYPLTDRKRYIVIDCVKDAYDDEQIFIDFKDYQMKLQYLNGLEAQPKGVGSKPIADSLNIDSDDDLGGIFDTIKTTVQNVAEKVAPVVHAVDTVNPATVLLRNGFLASMELNLFNVAGRIKWAYLTDEQAKKLNINIDALNKLRVIKDRAETAFWQAGGQKENLKKAILTGKGNKDKQVPLSGLGQLGEPVTAAAITAAASLVAALGLAVKQISGLFKSGSKEDAEFQSEKDGEQTATAGGNTPALPNASVSPNTRLVPMLPQTLQTQPNNTATETQRIFPTGVKPMPDMDNQNTIVQKQEAQTQNNTQNGNNNGGSSPNLPVAPNTGNGTPPEEKTGFFKKAGDWAKKNPSVVAGAGVLIIGGGMYLYSKHKAHHAQKPKTALSGVPAKNARKKQAKKNAKAKVQIIKI